MGLIKSLEQKEIEHCCIVRLSTTAWHNARGVHLKRSLLFLKRKCKGFNLLEEDASNMGALEALLRLENLDECQDGIYQVVACNEQTDWKTGIVDDYDLKLIPYKEEPK